MVKPTEGINNKSTYICGIDLARTGKDQTAIVVLEQPPFNHPQKYIVHMEALHTPDLMDAVGRVKQLNTLFKFTKIYVDETGLGAGVTDLLKEGLGHIVEGITFTVKSKAEMFMNLKLLLQNKTLMLPSYEEKSNPIYKKLIYQMMGINYRYNSQQHLLLSHDARGHDDLVCALALACSYFNMRRNIQRSYGIAG